MNVFPKKIIFIQLNLTKPLNITHYVVDILKYTCNIKTFVKIYYNLKLVLFKKCIKKKKTSLF